MKLREFYEFNSQIKGINDLVKATCIFSIDGDTMNSLIKEFNENNDRKLKGFEYNGLYVNFYDNALRDCLEKLGISEDTVEDIYDTDFGDLEITDVYSSEYNGIEIELKMPEHIFNEYKRYFMHKETHRDDEFEE